MEDLPNTSGENERIEKTMSYLREYAEMVYLHRPERIYEFSRDFFKNMTYKDEREKGTVSMHTPKTRTKSRKLTLESAISFDPDLQFRHRTVYMRQNSSVLDAKLFLEFSKTQEEIELLKNTLKNISFFSEMNEQAIGEVVASAMVRPFTENEVIIEQGTDIFYFYLVQDGILKAYCKDRNTGEDVVTEVYMKGSFFGQQALRHYSPSPNKIQAVTQGILWFLESKTYREIEFRYRFHERQMFDFILRTVDILKHLPKDEKDQIIDAFQIKIYDPNDLIVHESCDTGGMFFIEQGGVAFSFYDDNKMNFVEVFRLGPGEYFGEMTLLHENEKNVFRITAVENSIIAFVDADAFHRLLKDSCMDELEGNTGRMKSAFRLIIGMELEEAIKNRWGAY